MKIGLLTLETGPADTELVGTEAAGIEADES